MWDRSLNSIRRATAVAALAPFLGLVGGTATFGWSAIAYAEPVTTVIADVNTQAYDGGPQVNAFAGRLVWSNYDASIGAYRLMTYVDGQVFTAAIDPSSKPFDIDLGPGPTGETIAVYSSCALRHRHGCKLYSYDFATNREKRLNRTDSSAASEIAPTVWKSRVAFASVASGKIPRLYVGPLNGSGAFRRVEGGVARCRQGRRVWRGTVMRDSLDLDLHGNHLLFTWVFNWSDRWSPAPRRRSAIPVCDDIAANYGGTDTIDQLSLDRIGGKQDSIVSGSGGGTGGVRVTSPALRGESAYFNYRETLGESLTAGVGRYALDSGKDTLAETMNKTGDLPPLGGVAPGPDGSLFAAVFVVRDPPSASGWQIARLDGLTFKPSRF